jgi:glycosyltransferase involved in cell wall biosynthesis
MKTKITGIPIHTRYLVLTHYMVDGAPHALVRYLNGLVGTEVTYVGHPVEPGFANHECFISSQSVTRARSQLKARITLPVVCWIWDIIITLFWVIKFKRTYKTCIAAGCVNVMAALILKYLGIVDIVIFYSIDFVPIRFSNSLLQRLYRFFDNAAYVMADVTWCLTGRMVTARKLQVGSFRSARRDVIVPIGTNSLVLPYKESDIERYTIVYVGMILEKQGLQIIIPALGPLKRKYPAIRLRIVGDGPFLSNIRDLAQAHDVENLVEFCGLITDRGQLAERVGTAAVGLATYVPNNDSFTWFADPTKPKDYMALGIPIIITEVPEISQKIHASGAGQLVAYDTKSVFDAIDKLLGEDDYWRKARQSAIDLSHEYRWDTIFKRALSSSVSTAQSP